MRIVKTSVMWRNNVYNLSLILRCFVAKSVIFQFTLFCSKIGFVAIYALLRKEKLSKKLWSLRKNDKYEVWGGIVYSSTDPLNEYNIVAVDLTELSSESKF